jgi:hypothetical protein
MILCSNFLGSRVLSAINLGCGILHSAIIMSSNSIINPLLIAIKIINNALGVADFEVSVQEDIDFINKNKKNMENIVNDSLPQYFLSADKILSTFSDSSIQSIQNTINDLNNKITEKKNLFNKYISDLNNNYKVNDLDAKISALLRGNDFLKKSNNYISNIGKITNEGVQSEIKSILQQHCEVLKHNILSQTPISYYGTSSTTLTLFPINIKFVDNAGNFCTNITDSLTGVEYFHNSSEGRYIGFNHKNITPTSSETNINTATSTTSAYWYYTKDNLHKILIQAIDSNDIIVLYFTYYKGLHIAIGRIWGGKEIIDSIINPIGYCVTLDAENIFKNEANVVKNTVYSSCKFTNSPTLPRNAYSISSNFQNANIGDKITDPKLSIQNNTAPGTISLIDNRQKLNLPPISYNNIYTGTNYDFRGKEKFDSIIGLTGNGQNHSIRSYYNKNLNLNMMNIFLNNNGLMLTTDLSYFNTNDFSYDFQFQYKDRLGVDQVKNFTVYC